MRRSPNNTEFRVRTVRAFGFHRLVTVPAVGWTIQPRDHEQDMKKASMATEGEEVRLSETYTKTTT
jgi:hypothetical protein